MSQSDLTQAYANFVIGGVLEDHRFGRRVADAYRQNNPELQHGPATEHNLYRMEYEAICLGTCHFIEDIAPRVLLKKKLFGGSDPDTSQINEWADDVYAMLYGTIEEEDVFPKGVKQLEPAMSNNRPSAIEGHIVIDGGVAVDDVRVYRDMDRAERPEYFAERISLSLDPVNLYQSQLLGLSFATATVKMAEASL